tara:strand:+ start:13 stop:222 length:210 start_codon:yes stop_codon:yes gene_type:complete
MKAKIIQNGFYDSYADSKFIALDNDRDTLFYYKVSQDKKIIFKVKRGMPWNDKYSQMIELDFDQYIAIS